MRQLAPAFALLIIAGCSKDQGREGSMSSAGETTSGTERTSGTNSTYTEPNSADSSTYHSTTTYTSPAGDGTTGQQGATGTQSASAGGMSQQQGANNVDVDAIRSVLLREYPNSADTIRAMTITENGGLVTLEGVILDERARPEIVAIIQRVPGVKNVNDQLRSSGGGPNTQNKNTNNRQQ